MSSPTVKYTVEPAKVRKLLNGVNVLPPDVHNSKNFSIMNALESAEKDEQEKGVSELRSFIESGFRAHKHMVSDGLKKTGGITAEERIKLSAFFETLVSLENSLSPDPTQ